MAFQTDSGVLKLITYVAVVADARILLVRYDVAPNPERSGWWIPAPELEYGQAPDALADEVLDDLGLAGSPVSLLETESFVTPNGWHCIFHYLARPGTEPRPSARYTECAWFGASELPSRDAFAHGAWEHRLALKRLGQATG